jgi:hypothetical protein
MMLMLTRLVAKTRTPPSTFGRIWWRMIACNGAALARAASTKSRLWTCVVRLSVTRTSGGVKTTVNDRIVLEMPAPITPQIAIASNTDGNA